jgi:hypothetical protein
MRLLPLLLAGLLCVASQPASAAGVGLPFTPADDLAGGWEFTPDPALPDVLLIGDSISIAYTRPVRAILSGKANVYRVMSPDGRKPGNGGDTRMGLAGLDAWLAGHRWQVIHFNWGLWDLCYRDPASTNHGNRDKVKGKLAVSLEEYARNLEQLVLRLKATGAILIWANTTVVPENELGRVAGDEINYNRIAAAIMARHGVIINDLHALTATMPAEKFRAPADVHYTAEASAELANQVAGMISAALKDQGYAKILKAAQKLRGS